MQEMSGAYVGCECSACRELRLRDPDRVRFTLHDLTQAWREGYLACLLRMRP